MKHAPFLLLLPFATVAPWLNADAVVLRNGKIIEGTFIGGSPRQVEFLAASGQTMKVPVAEVTSLRFSPPETPEPPPPQPAKPSTRPGVMIRAGTSFRVRTTDPIDGDSTKAGAKFRGVVDDPIMSGGNVIVPRGADVVLVAAKVQQGGRFKGSDLIE